MAATPQGTLPASDIRHSSSEWEKSYLKIQSRRQRRAEGVERCSRGRARSIPVMVADHENMENLNTAQQQTVHEYCCAAVHGG